jgi:hypothetical protein
VFIATLQITQSRRISPSARRAAAESGDQPSGVIMSFTLTDSTEMGLVDKLSRHMETMANIVADRASAEKARVSNDDDPDDEDF